MERTENGVETKAPILNYEKKSLTLENFKTLAKDGPMVKASDDSVRRNILTLSLERGNRFRQNQNQQQVEDLFKNVEQLPTQVGGYKPDNPKKILLKAGPYALKPLQTSDRGMKEIAFYEAISIVQEKTHQRLDQKSDMDILQKWFTIHMQNYEHREEIDFTLDESTFMMQYQIKHDIDLIQRLAKHTSRYFGVVQLKQPIFNTISIDNFDLSDANEIATSPNSYMVFQDLTSSFSKPCILDLKMGCQTYEPDASQKKKDQEQKKYSMQSTFGFRVVGMKCVYDLSTGSGANTLNDERPNENYRTYDKHYGCSLNTKDKLLSAFRTFFYSPTTDAVSSMEKKMMYQRRTCLQNLLLKLQLIRKWFEDNNTFSFYSSSLLVIYEGGIDSYIDKSIKVDEKSKDRDVPNNESLYMIDFCHVRREKGGHPGYLHGVKTLIEMWRILLHELECEIERRS